MESSGLDHHRAAASQLATRASAVGGAMSSLFCLDFFELSYGSLSLTLSLSFTSICLSVCLPFTSFWLFPVFHGHFGREAAAWQAASGAALTPKAAGQS